MFVKRKQSKDLKTQVSTKFQMLKTQVSKNSVFQRNKVRRSEDKVSTEVQMLKTCVSNNKVLKIRVLKTKC